MFKIKRLSVKHLCILAILLSLTVVLSWFSGLLRIGNAVKFSISFVAVYVAGALFGAFFGGFIGAAADVISYLINPAGVFLWQLSLIEFLYGFSYGLLFHTSRRRYAVIRVLLCGLVQFFINLIVKTYVLMSVGYVPKPFFLSLTVRFPAAALMFFLQTVVIYLFERFYIEKFRRML